ncbi:MAG: hypothetical protein KatS3mg083_271 [Candidatus Dojkabacteria bacterium]|nr:MAG: hypothetical protein KatS3mg083_271 [Candidatus Dojkabacteria bacterium]
MTDLEILYECIQLLGLSCFNPRRTRITSPFRPDRNPGCYFWTTRDGRVFFVDWAAEKTHMPIREFYERIKGGHFSVKKADSYVPIKDKGVSEKYIKILETERPTHVQVAKRYFQRYGVEYEDIKKKYGIVAVSKYAIVYRSGKKKEVEVQPYDLCLLILQTPKGKVKLYYPYRKMQKDKLKFVSTVSNDDIEFLSRNKRKVLITKSKKDAIMLDLLYGYKYDICWVQGEITLPSHNFIAKNFLRYDEICIFFDNDYAGFKGADRLVELIKNLYPKKEVRTMIIPEELRAKDTSDYIASYAGG